VEPAVEHGLFTGRLREPLCIDDGKVHWASTLARELGVRLDECTFYTDDVGDVPLLELVGEPVAVNPDPRLRRVAVRRGWRVVDFAAPGERADRGSPTRPCAGR
jgi:phosphoserine phosphatase